MLRVSLDVLAAENMIERAATSQLPFAFAYTLTLTANDARQEIVHTLPQKFVLRTGWWKPFSYMGFNVRPAKKKWLVAEIYTRAYFMQYQEEGVTKKPTQARSIAVPTKGIRKKSTQKITRSMRPYALLRRATKPAFFINTTTGSVLFRRVTKKQLVSQYVMSKQAVIKPRLGMKDTAERILQRKLYENFETAFIQAMQTAR